MRWLLKMIKIIAKILVMVGIFAIISCSFIYFFALTTKSYAEAKVFISRDERVARFAGVPKEIGLKFLGDLSMTSDDAYFTFDITSEKGDSVANIYLQKLSGAWYVRRVTIKTYDDKTEDFIVLPEAPIRVRPLPFPTNRPVTGDL